MPALQNLLFRRENVLCGTAEDAGGSNGAGNANLGLTLRNKAPLEDSTHGAVH